MQYVDAVSEPDGQPEVAVDVEHVGVAVLALVAVGRARQEEQRFVRGNRDAVPLGVGQ